KVCRRKRGKATDMWTSAWRNKFFTSFGISGVMLSSLAWAGPIATINFLKDPGSPASTFTAGVSTNTGSGPIWISFSATGGAIADAGETVTLSLLENGQVVAGGVTCASSTSFTTDGVNVIWGTTLNPLPFTFFHAGSGLEIRVVSSVNGVTKDSQQFA